MIYQNGTFYYKQMNLQIHVLISIKYYLSFLYCLLISAATQAFIVTGLRWDKAIEYLAYTFKHCSADGKISDAIFSLKTDFNKFFSSASHGTEIKICLVRYSK